MRRKLTTTLLGAALALAAQAQAQPSEGARQVVDVRRGLAMMPFGQEVGRGGLFLNQGARLPRRATTMTFTPNWKTQFDTEDEFGWFTVIDANGDASEGYGGDVQNAWSWRSDSKCAWYYCWNTVTDDWLVTPGLHLRAGKNYTLRFKTTVMNTNFPAEMDVMLGREATAEALTVPIVEGDVTTGMGYEEKQAAFTVEEDGVYYIGFHLTKVNYLLSFYMDDVSVEGTPFGGSPAAVTDMVVTPDATGDVKADISFTLPTLTCSGEELKSLGGVKIRHGEVEVADLKNVRPGQRVTFTMNGLEEAGYQSFTVIPYNDVDDGEGTQQVAYIGLDTPSVPQNLKLIDDEDHITVTWDESVGAHGGVFFPERVDYRIYDIARNEYGQEVVGDVVAQTTGETTLQIDVNTNEGEQRLKDYLINAENAAGPSNNFYRSWPILLGRAYEAPFLETFDNGLSSHFFMQGVQKQGYSSTGIYSWSYDGFDSTPGSIAMTAQNAGDSVYFYTGKIDLRTAQSPKLVCKMMNMAYVGRAYVYVKLPSGEDILLEEMPLADDELKGQWVTKKFDLSAWVQERYVQVGFAMATDVKEYGANRVLVDHIFVGDVPQTALSVELTAPKSVVKGQHATLSARVNNLGDADVEKLTLTVTAAGREIGSFETEQPLESMEFGTFDIQYQSNLLDLDSEARIVATVKAEGSEEEATDEAVIRLNEPAPTPTTGLTATEKATDDGSHFELAWNEAPEIVNQTDDFESYKAWTTYQEWQPGTVGDWTMVDGDGGYCWGFSDTWYYAERSQFAFTVFNPYNYDGRGTSLFSLINEDYSKPFVPHSGDQYLAGIYSGEVVWNEETGNYEGTIEDADNWLISPEQDGRAQEISFFVNNYAGLAGNGQVIDHVETYEVLYSTTDTQLASFTAIDGDRQASGGEWQEVKVQLPEGTKYFAIHHKSAYNETTGSPFIFMIDDVSVQVDNAPVDHYNIYRDGELVGRSETTTFIDLAAPLGNYLYQVTVVYEDGSESSPVSLQAIGVPTSIESLPATAASAETKAYGVNGIRISDGANAKSIRVMKGKKVMR